MPKLSATSFFIQKQEKNDWKSVKRFILEKLKSEIWKLDEKQVTSHLPKSR